MKKIVLKFVCLLICLVNFNLHSMSADNMKLQIGVLEGSKGKKKVLSEMLSECAALNLGATTQTTKLELYRKMLAFLEDLNHELRSLDAEFGQLVHKFQAQQQSRELLISGIASDGCEFGLLTARALVYYEMLNWVLDQKNTLQAGVSDSEGLKPLIIMQLEQCALAKVNLHSRMVALFSHYKYFVETPTRSKTINTEK